MESHTTHHLNVKMAHSQHPVAGLPDDRKGLRQELIQAASIRQSLLELPCFRREFLIGEGLHRLFMGIDLRYHLAHALQFAVVAGTKYLLDRISNHCFKHFEI